MKYKKDKNMKKVVFYMMLLVMSIGYAYAQGKADIKFEQTTHNFGTFSENSPVVSYTFKFTTSCQVLELAMFCVTLLTPRRFP